MHWLHVCEVMWVGGPNLSRKGLQRMSLYPGMKQSVPNKKALQLRLGSSPFPGDLTQVLPPPEVSALKMLFETGTWINAITFQRC